MNRLLSLLPLIALAAGLTVMATRATAQDAPPPPPTDAPRGEQGDRPAPPPPPDDDRGDRGDRSDRGGRDGGRFRGRPGPPLTTEEFEIAVELIDMLEPDRKMSERLREHYQTDPEQVSRRLQESFPRIRFFIEMRRNDPELFDLRIADMRLTAQTRRLARQYRAAVSSEPAEPGQPDDDAPDAQPQPSPQELRAQLAELVARHFDIRQQIREHDLAKLENHLLRLREELDARAEDRDQLVEDRVQELTGERDDAQW